MSLTFHLKCELSGYCSDLFFFFFVPEMIPAEFHWIVCDHHHSTQHFSEPTVGCRYYSSGKASLRYWHMYASRFRARQGITWELLVVQYFTHIKSTREEGSTKKESVFQDFWNVFLCFFPKGLKASTLKFKSKSFHFVCAFTLLYPSTLAAQRFLGT